MKTLLFLSLAFLISCGSPDSTKDLTANTASETEVLSQLLTDFLNGASVNDYDMHNRFWADDLVYTGSAGTRTSKELILAGVRNAEPTDEPTTRYHAEEVDIRVYDETAIVAFKLVGVDSDESRMEFYNTGTFLKRDGNWQAVAWQATRIPAN